MANDTEIPDEMLHDLNIDPWAVFLLMSLILAISSYLTNLFVQYLLDQPFGKQCLMSRLCQDILIANLMFVGLWTVSAIMFRFFEVTGEAWLVPEMSGYVSLIGEALFLLIMLYLGLIGALRLYVNRFHVLDPLEEWSGESEVYSITLIRIFVSIVVILQFGLLWLNSIKPITYYKITDPKLKWEILPRASWLLLAFDILLSTICAILFTSGIIYRRFEDNKLGLNRIEVGIPKMNDNTTNASTTEEGTQEENSKDSGTSNQPESQSSVINTVAIPSLMYIGNGLLIVLIILLQYFNVISLGFWWCITVSVAIEGVLMPAVFIMRNPDLRIYCLRQVKRHESVVLGCVRGVVSFFLQCNARVHPLA